MINWQPMTVFNKSRATQLKNNKNDYMQCLNQIKNRCEFQINFSTFLLIFFFILQYSIPIFLVLLGSVATSREQISLFLKETPLKENKNTEQKSDPEEVAKKNSDLLVSKIIFLLGIVTILLGVINNTVRPSENYDTCVNFNNKFHKFYINLALEMLKTQALNKEPNHDLMKNQEIYDLLVRKNEELSNLIDDFNKARSLSPRQANIKALDDLTANSSSNQPNS